MLHQHSGVMTSCRVTGGEHGATHPLGWPSWHRPTVGTRMLGQGPPPVAPQSRPSLGDCSELFDCDLFWWETGEKGWGRGGGSFMRVLCSQNNKCFRTQNTTFLTCWVFLLVCLTRVTAVSERLILAQLPGKTLPRLRLIGWLLVWQDRSASEVACSPGWAFL